MMLLIKKLVISISSIVLLLCFSLNIHANEIKIKELVGSFYVVPKTQIPYLDAGMSIEYEIAISKKQDEFGAQIVGLNEYVRQKSPTGSAVNLSSLKCSGSANLTSQSILELSVVCRNKAAWDLKINLVDIKDINSSQFTAPVYSSLYGTEIEMVIARRENSH